MTTEVASARAQLAQLFERNSQGTVSRKDFDRRTAELTVQLYRALAQQRLPNGDEIVAEHHVVLGHTKLTQSVLKETEQEFISLFATRSRLVRVRAHVMPGVPPTADSRDRTEVDEIDRAAITGLSRRRRIRSGEIFAGLAIAAFALVFRPWLQITGTLMVALGVLGALHGLLLPTRWIEIESGARELRRPFAVHAVRRRSARTLLASLRAAPARDG